MIRPGAINPRTTTQPAPGQATAATPDAPFRDPALTKLFDALRPPDQQRLLGTMFTFAETIQNRTRSDAAVWLENDGWKVTLAVDTPVAPRERSFRGYAIRHAPGETLKAPRDERFFVPAPTVAGAIAAIQDEFYTRAPNTARLSATPDGWEEAQPHTIYVSHELSITANIDERLEALVTGLLASRGIFSLQIRVGFIDGNCN